MGRNMRQHTGHHRNRQDHRGTDRKGLGEGQGAEELAFLIGEENTGTNETIVFETAVIIAPPHFRRALVDILEMTLARDGTGDSAVDVFGHDDAHVGNIPDGNRQASERHDVRIHQLDTSV